MVGPDPVPASRRAAGHPPKNQVIRRSPHEEEGRQSAPLLMASRRPWSNSNWLSGLLGYASRRQRGGTRSRIAGSGPVDLDNTRRFRDTPTGKLNHQTSYVRDKPAAFDLISSQAAHDEGTSPLSIRSALANC